MQLQLRDTTKMAIQAMFAVIITEGLSYAFNLERSYWAVLTAMSITAQTWGESVKRSLERIIMTIIGGCFGTLLYFLIPHQQTLIIAILLLFIFFSVYTYRVSFFSSIFFITSFVVFLFALIDEWTLSMLEARIIETIIGASVALLTSRTIFPLRTDTHDVFSAYFKKLVAMLANCETAKIHTLVLDFQELKKSSVTISYELIFHRLNQSEFNHLLLNTQQIMHYSTSFIEAYNENLAKLNSQTKSWIDSINSNVVNNMNQLILSIDTQNHESHQHTVQHIEVDISKHIQSLRKHGAPLSVEAVDIYSMVYFLNKINNAIVRCYQIIH